ncbi:MAG: hypothetical protein JO189_23300, partial [Deltaproteobacteria bacterium]|nr:hypothetical protein [Deltaproteobacteria bacterium]
MRLKLEQANRHAPISGIDQLPGTANYFIGQDPKHWRTNIPTYAQVEYHSVYPGIDLLYHGSTQG